MEKQTVLVLEDEVLISMDVEEALIEAGFHVAALRSCVDAAAFLADHRPDAAVLDVRLTDGDCSAIARHLVDQGVPFVVHTGMISEGQDPVFLLGARVTKPAGATAIVDRVKALLTVA
ncbi:response regulator [Mesorhizobium sp. NZP2298]|uniref:response regulator n=1 Tax=Mesorhizobium sp. NZP2298 TaxID=2483403 RepID=UPI001557B498|nr:response regulator [Mesorhizobium sp. NZP2298]